jgi:hypothetical protein
MWGGYYGAARAASSGSVTIFAKTVKDMKNLTFQAQG